ncbi:hypothetical protein LCM20_11520 [Halobacillus litoralis]|uniref:hypothetical protein n=1 Tax=Halobacillus litoralis TaxID=45668 RepID=UPI001CD1D83C|nr:hypothetical protein [Halobacillus litoralis]MCA0971224.1 hypothetical protein [Halobacillus litoralis]
MNRSTAFIFLRAGNVKENILRVGEKVSLRNTYTAVLALTAVLSVVLALMEYLSADMFIRSLITFVAAPSFLVYANQKRLWFRKSFRWLIKCSQSPPISGSFFMAGALISYDGLTTIPYGFFLHLIPLTIASVLYWSPFLVNCSFSKPISYMHQFAYFTITSIVFFTYHQMTFYFYEAQPTFGYMVIGTAVMIVTLLSLIMNWAKDESHIDRMTVKGLVQPIKEDHK